jgi:hypothetical protein
LQLNRDPFQLSAAKTPSLITALFLLICARRIDLAADEQRERKKEREGAQTLGERTKKFISVCQQSRRRREAKMHARTHSAGALRTHIFR